MSWDFGRQFRLLHRHEPYSGVLHRIALGRRDVCRRQRCGASLTRPILAWTKRWRSGRTRSKPRRTLLTHISHDLDHQRTSDGCPTALSWPTTACASRSTSIDRGHVIGTFRLCRRKESFERVNNRDCGWRCRRCLGCNAGAADERACRDHSLREGSSMFRLPTAGCPITSAKRLPIASRFAGCNARVLGEAFSLGCPGSRGGDLD